MKKHIAQAIFNYETENIKQKYNLNITASSIKYEGLRTIHLRDLSVFSINADTLAYFESLETKLSLINLVTLSINPLEVTIENSYINIHSALSYANSSSSSISANKIATKSENSTITKLSTIIRRFFGLSTARFNVSNFSINYCDSIYSESLLINNWVYKGSKFTAEANYTDKNGVYKFHIDGLTNKKANAVSISINGNGKQAKIPFTEPALGIAFYLDSARMEVQAKNISKNSIGLTLKTKANNFLLIGNRIAETPVEIDSAAANLLINLYPNFYSIDTLSVVKLNKLAASLGVSYTSTPDSTINIKLNTLESSWQELIESLPKGLFSNLSGIKLGGRYKYQLAISLNLNSIDSLAIEPRLISKGFSIQSYGNTNFSAIRDTFTHKVYQDGVYIKSIYLGKSNKYYTPLESISPLLRWAIITSEDGSFYNHQGFDLDGIRYAMACNIREKRFARGGSTISQQLIKNLFLDKNKNITRKFEESLIVWMVENYGIVSKDRMLEIYLNIIEWGPGVYGVKEACEYYFNKKPSEVSLQEALFLAYIVPRPTKFRYLFDSENHLKPFMASNFDFVSKKMLARGYITDDDCSTIANTIDFRLTGEAIKTLSRDSVQIDTTELVNWGK